MNNYTYIEYLLEWGQLFGSAPFGLRAFYDGENHERRRWMLIGFMDEAEFNQAKFMLEAAACDEAVRFEMEMRLLA